MALDKQGASRRWILFAIITLVLHDYGLEACNSKNSRYLLRAYLT